MTVGLNQLAHSSDLISLVKIKGEGERPLTRLAISIIRATPSSSSFNLLPTTNKQKDQLNQKQKKSPYFAFVVNDDTGIDIGSIRLVDHISRVRVAVE